MQLSMSQVIVMPKAFVVFKREVFSNMYRPVPYYFARILTQLTWFMVYSFTVTLTLTWQIGLKNPGYEEYLGLLCPLFLTAM